MICDRNICYQQEHNNGGCNTCPCNEKHDEMKLTEDKMIEVCVNDINHAFYGLVEACKEALKQLRPAIDKVAKLMQEINEANKPTQGREVFRGFVEGKNKSKNRFDRRYKR